MCIIMWVNTGGVCCNVAVSSAHIRENRRLERAAI